MRRLERRVMRLNDELARLAEELRLARAELEVHSSLADDAARDAAVFDTPFDREDEREIRADVARFERLVADLDSRIDRLQRDRARLLARLDG